MSIDYADVFPILAEALPDFQASEDDWEEPTPYFFLGDMVQFVCQKASEGSIEVLDKFSVLLERLVSDGDSNVRDLVLDALEGLRENSNQDVVSRRFGPKTLEIWRKTSHAG
jgi:hypothetical protein